MRVVGGDKERSEKVEKGGVVIEKEGKLPTTMSMMCHVKYHT